MKMKKFFYLLMAMSCCLTYTSCGDDNDWDYDHSLENVYYFGPEVWGYDTNKKGNNNVVIYSVKQGGTVEIPMQFWCEFVRSYDVETYYYVTPKPAGEKYYPSPASGSQVSYDGTVLTCGVDYEVVDAQGQRLMPNADGAYVMTWPNAVKGVQNIYIKALNGKTGAFNLQTFNPNSSTTLSNQDVESTVQNRTEQYEVRIFTQNYRVTVAVEQ